MSPTEKHVTRVCQSRFLPIDKIAEADRVAFMINPRNRLAGEHLGASDASGQERLVVNRRVFWGKQGVLLTVGFLDAPDAGLKKKILIHMNAWNAKGANVQFVESETDPQVRIARADQPREKAGYWSFLGTDILTIPKDEPTMNLEGFTMATPDTEFRRVVRHETGHTLGFPHEHLRAELVAKLDRDKVFAAYSKSYGWSRDEVDEQVLTPLEESSNFGSSSPDPRSIMCYEIVGDLTIDGQPIIGGTDIDELDYDFVGNLYPNPNP